MLTVCERRRLNKATLVADAMHTMKITKIKYQSCQEFAEFSIYLQSEFLTDCFFFDGFEITLILFVKNEPIS